MTRSVARSRGGRGDTALDRERAARPRRHPPQHEPADACAGVPRPGQPDGG